jgi:hypothetical protein
MSESNKKAVAAREALDIIEEISVILVSVMALADQPKR